MSQFERPPNLEYPKIYRIFKAFDADSSVKAKFIIQDLPQERFDDAIKFMIEYFIAEEPALKSRDIKLDKPAVIEIQGIWRKILAQNISIVCFKEGNDDIIGVNILGVKTQQNDENEGNNDEDEDRKLISKDLFDIISLHKLLEKESNPFKTHKIEAYISDFGFAVHTDYRRRGIGTEILKCRSNLLQDFELKVTTSHFVGNVSQNLAAKAQYEEDFALSYDELYRMNTNFYFSGVDGSNVKVMSLKAP